MQPWTQNTQQSFQASGFGHKGLGFRGLGFRGLLSLGQKFQGLSRA